MKKSDFIEVHVYVVNTLYGGGILFTKEKVTEKANFTEYHDYHGTTLLTKEFIEEWNKNNSLDFTYIE